MSKYCLVHISDIHANEKQTHLIERFEKAAGAIALNGAGTTKSVIFLVTGDIANTGKPQEYQFAQQCFDKVRTLLEQKGIAVKFFFAPGNHDCDFSHPMQTVREFLVKDSASKLSREKAPESVLQTFICVQEQFHNFAGQNGCALKKDRLVTVIDDQNQLLRVNVINTAWASELRENDNRPFVLSELDVLEAAPGVLNISIFHHPKSWIDKHVVSEFSKKIHEASDFVLSGHEHNSNTYENKYINGDSQIYFEAGAFYDHAGDSKFRCILVDHEGSTIDVTDFEWDSNDRTFKERTYDKIPLPKNPQTNALGLLVEPKFLKHLRDPGVSLKHSMKRELELRDFFVFPRLVVDSDVTGETGPMKIIQNEADFVESLKAKKVHLIAGDDKAGKTALCKSLFESFFSRGFLPVFAEGSDFQSASAIVTKNKIDDLIKKQFKNCGGLNLLQNPDVKAVLIVDRFDQIPLDLKKVGDLIGVFSDLFETIILTADSSVEIQLIDDPRLGMPVDEISRLTIAPMTSAQRKMLIANWFSIGNTIEVDPNDVRTHQSELYISSLISEYGIPSYPLFVLTYLQFAESENTLNLKISSNAKLLETLVDLGLASVVDPKVPYQTKLAYLREFAFKMHLEGKKKFSAQEIDQFHYDYCNRLDVIIAKSTIWRELTEAKILVNDEDGSGGFKYGYYRSYFVAGYLQFNSSADISKSTLQQLVENIHVSENANIIATLSLFSSETWILKRLKSKLDETLPGVEIGNYRTLSSVVKEVTKVDAFPLLPSSSTHEPEEEQKPAPQAEPTDLALSISYAIKLVKVLGQLIRNSANAIDGKLKRELIESIFQAASRILAVQTSAIKHEKDDILLFLYHKLKEKRPTLAEPEIKSEASRRLMFLVFGSTLSLIDVVSRAVGDEFLAPTFKKMEEDDPNKNFDFYILGIKLDWYRAFPKHELFSLYEETNGLGFMGFMVRYLAYRGMAFRGGDIGAQTIQEVCAKLEMDYRKLQIKTLNSSKKPRVD